MSRKKRNMESSYTKNKEMNSETYKLRREVMKHIYEAKKLIGESFPRVELRIADANEKGGALVVGRLGQNIIWITPVAISEYNLRAIVYHEIGHAVYGLDHDENCPLMKATISKSERATKGELDKLLMKYAKGA